MRTRFADDEGSQFEAEINLLAEAGITTGCAVDRFCPVQPVLRDQMATFLARAELLDPIVVPAGCSILPADNIWNTRVDNLPVHSRSRQYVSSIGHRTTMHPDFGSGSLAPRIRPARSGFRSPRSTPASRRWRSSTPTTATRATPDRFRFHPTATVEGGPSGSGDRHVIVVDRVCLPSLRVVLRLAPGRTDRGKHLRAPPTTFAPTPSGPTGWTSADAAGLPIFPGLVTYDEVAAGYIGHAIRFTASETQRAYVWPARHFASSDTSLDLPPMGQRFRLKASFDISGFAPEIQVILTAFKQFGLILADNGSSWYVSGAPDPRWDNDVLRELKTIPGSAFEAVDVSSLQVSPDSGQAG